MIPYLEIINALKRKLSARRERRVCISFNTIDRELDALRVLQGVEFACQVRGLESLFIKSDFGGFHDLKAAFAFSRAKLISGVPKLKEINGDELYSTVRYGPNFVAAFSEHLSSFLGSPMRSTLSPHGIRSDAVYIFEQHNHLGDAISIIWGFESYCRENNISEVRISGGKVFNAVIDVFEINHVKYVESYGDCAVSLDHLFRLSDWNTSWLKRFNMVLTMMFGGRASTKAQTLALRNVPKIKKSNIIYCQFDSRSASRYSMKTFCRAIAAICGREQVVALGGYDTTQYLGKDFEYSLGDLSHICHRLLECKFFVGADSGIGHLAGVLGVKGYIFNCIDFEAVYHLFSEYKQLTVVNSAILETPGMALIEQFCLEV